MADRRPPAPKVGRPWFAYARIKPRERRLITEYPWLGADEGKQRVVEKLKPPGDPRHPGPERASIDDHAAGGEHLGLAMQRQMPGELRDGDMGCKGRGHHAAIHHACRRGRLHNNAFAGPACIARPDRPFDPDNRGHDVERLADVRADAMQFERTAGASLALRLDDLVITRKVLGQAADIAGWRSPCLRFVFIDRRDIIIRATGTSLTSPRSSIACVGSMIVIFSDFGPKSWPSRKATRALRSAFSSSSERMIRVNCAASWGKRSGRSGMTDPTI